MRRLLSIIFLMCCLAASAQRDCGYEPSFYDSSRPDHLIEFKPNVAVGLSSLLQNYANVIPGLSDMQLSPGVLTRVGLDVRLAFRKSFAIGVGMSLDFNNSKYALSIVDNNTGSINSIYMRNNYREVQVPVYLSWRFNLGRRMRWNVDVGSYLAFAAGGNMKASGYTSGHNSLGQPVIEHVSYTTKYFKQDVAIINGIKDFDYGPRMATGLTYHSHYSLNLICEMSVPNLAINHNVIDAHYRNISFAFEFGYNF